MESVLIICLSGVMYAGQLLQELNLDEEWIAIKPSKSSRLLMYFKKERIKDVYLLNGEKKELIKSDLTQKAELDLHFPKKNVRIVRVKGGVSFRGENFASLESFGSLAGNISLVKGLLISPSLEQETLIYIPNEEIEEVFGA